jgi:hypothetical protein
VDQEGLWFKVLVDEYEMSDGRLKSEGRKTSLCRKDFCDVSEGVS